MATSRYRNFLKICEKWPVSKSRGDRDLGMLLRKRIMETFSKAEASKINEVECDRIYTSLQNIVGDVHRNKWMRLRVTNATGTSAESLSQALSDEGLQDLGAEGAKSTRTRMKDKILSVIPSSRTEKKDS